ncbi:MAG: hypothetical protein GX102_00010 [Porphyromonadaceae bacterium]|nr:hypothetical protein [Porphyromonadaceae bacterium]
MKRVYILFLALITSMPAFCQSFIQDGDRCFDAGDYACAIAKYENAFKNTTGRDKQIAEIKLTQAKWCADHLESGNKEFEAKNYFIAKQDYQKVLDTNPNDIYAQSQIAKCVEILNPPRLRKATTAELTDILNNKYGSHPQRRQNLINAGIDPDDAQRRINAGEGKPPENENQVITLSVSKSNLFFPSFGGTSEQIKVFTNASSFTIPTGYLPWWCTVKTYTGYFTVTASANHNDTSRKDWFVVNAGGRDLRINVEQDAQTRTTTQQSTTTNSQASQRNEKKCFNCPKARNPVGLVFGFTQQPIVGYVMDGVQVGLKIEPLFKYGFGLNTGINFAGFSKDILKFQFFEDDFDAHAINVPLHLEYRLNFSKWFNIFAYGGFGFNFVDLNHNNFIFPTTIDYGGGLCINRIQFNVGQSLYLVNLRNPQDFGK